MTAAFNISRSIRIKRALINNPVTRAISWPIGRTLKFVTRGYYTPGLTLASVEIAAKRLPSRSRLRLTSEGIYRGDGSRGRPAIAKNFLAHLLPEAEIRLESYQGRNVAEYFRSIRHAIYRFKRKYKAIAYKNIIAALLAKVSTVEKFKSWEKVIYTKFQAYAPTTEQEENGDLRVRLLAAYRNVLLACIIKGKNQQTFQAWIDRADNALADKPVRYVYIVGVLLKKAKDLRDFAAWHRAVYPEARGLSPRKLKALVKLLETTETIEVFQRRVKA